MHKMPIALCTLFETDPMNSQSAMGSIYIDRSNNRVNNITYWINNGQVDRETEPVWIQIGGYLKFVCVGAVTK